MVLHSDAAHSLSEITVDSLRSPSGPACGCYYASLRIALTATHFFQTPDGRPRKKVSKNAVPRHPELGVPVMLRSTPLTPSLLRGPDLGGPPTKGHPWPVAALGVGILRRSTSYIHVVVAAFMLLASLRNDSVRPSEGARV